MSSNDLTAMARIRDAAMELFGQQGFKATTMRQIARRAKVSLGLINHHFASKEKLRLACDDWVLDYVVREKLLVLTSGSLPELDRYIAERPEVVPILAYLTRALRDGGRVADTVFDALVSITRDLSREGVRAGKIKPSEDEDARAALMVAYSVGVLLFGQQVARHLGGTDIMDPAIQARYGRINLEIFTQGVLVEGAFELMEE